MFYEQITKKEAICLMILFIIGSTTIVGIGGAAKNDAWFAATMAIIMAIPVVLVYSRLLSLFPGHDLFSVLNLVFGNVAGRVLAILYIWYAFHLGALVIRNFGEFINNVMMPETPMLFPMLFLALVVIVAVKSGVEVMARTSAYVLPAVVGIILIVQLLAIPLFNFDYLFPLLHDNWGPVMMGTFSAFSFPYAETVLFIAVLSSLKPNQSPYKVYLTSLLLAGAIIMVLTLRNILVVGPELEHLNFPAHVAVSRIHLGDFIQRIEVTVSFVFTLGVIIKSSVCLFVASRGLGTLFGLYDYRSIVIQLGLLMVYFAYILYDNLMQMNYWAFHIYPYYAFPFQVVLPIIFWITAEIKVRKNSTSTFSSNEAKL
jgi:spore germination protein KB